MKHKTLKTIHLVGPQFGKSTGWRTVSGYVRVDFTDGTSTTRPEGGAIYGTLAALEKEGVDVRGFKQNMIRAELAGSHPPKPVHVAEYQHNYSAEKPVTLGAWQWSDTFGRWSRLVTFADGWHGYSYPQMTESTRRDAAALAAAWLGERFEAWRKCVGDDLAMAEAAAYFKREDVRKH